MKYKVCIVTTMSSSVDNWVKPFLNDYRQNDYDVTVVSNMSEDYKNQLLKEYPYVKPVNVTMPRGISLLGSLKGIWQLYKIFKNSKFDLVQYSTPNASFYSAIASYINKVPVRLYCQWGMVFVGMSGIKRIIFEMIERITCKISTDIQPDSHGNLEFGREIGLYSVNKSSVIWNGSAKGIDLEKYDYSKKYEFKKEIRDRYSIPDSSVVLGFVGRLGREKGCNELFTAFKKLNRDYQNMKLLFVGPIEKEDTIDPELIKWFYESPNVIVTGRVPDVEKHMAAMDVFVLPSYREGFGMSVVEAESMGVPVVVTKIPGPINGMIDGKTGLAIPVKNSDKIVEAVTRIISDRKMMKDMGENGVQYARENFDSKILIRKVIENRKKLIDNRKTGVLK